MKRGTYFRLLVLSLVSALLLSGISLLLLNHLADLAASRHRNEFISFLVDNLERRLENLTHEELKSLKAEELLDFPFGPPRPGMMGPPPIGMMRPPPPPPLGDDFDGPPPPPPDFGVMPLPPPSAMGKRMFLLKERGGLGGPRRPNFWLVEGDGTIINGNNPGKPLPKSWDKLPKSKVAGEIVTYDDLLHLSPSINIIKLDRKESVYMVMSEERKPFFGPLFLTQAALSFGAILTALVMAFSLVFFYMRKKSEEARAVLLRLERGDLNARFEIKRFDEFGGLMLDFNRMAHEIERLVSRIHATETTRKNLLQELGHDLRTPLTSLATSFETLRMHYDKMTQKDRDDLFEMTGAEVEYFKDLLEKLMTIATLDEPNYKQSTEMIDLREMLTYEIRARQNTSKLTWELSQNQEEPIYVTGDPILIIRLFKNAFDNASRYAKSFIRIRIAEEGNEVVIQVRDDGPGLSVKELENFARRRDQRTRREGDKMQFSLGLGSVIMKTIAELHDGTLEMKNVSGQNGDHGAELTIRLPKVSSLKK